MLKTPSSRHVYRRLAHTTATSKGGARGLVQGTAIHRAVPVPVPVRVYRRNAAAEHVVSSRVGSTRTRFKVQSNNFYTLCGNIEGTNNYTSHTPAKQGRHHKFPQKIAGTNSQRKFCAFCRDWVKRPLRAWIQQSSIAVAAAAVRGSAIVARTLSYHTTRCTERAKDVPISSFP